MKTQVKDYIQKRYSIKNFILVKFYFNSFTFYPFSL